MPPLAEPIISGTEHLARQSHVVAFPDPADLLILSFAA